MTRRQNCWTDLAWQGKPDCEIYRGRASKWDQEIKDRLQESER